MDIRTGRTYETLEQARAAGVPEADLAYVVQGERGPEPHFMPPKKWKFSKGSFKPVKHEPTTAKG